MNRALLLFWVAAATALVALPGNVTLPSACGRESLVASIAALLAPDVEHAANRDPLPHAPSCALLGNGGALLGAAPRHNAFARVFRLNARPWQALPRIAAGGSPDALEATWAAHLRAAARPGARILALGAATATLHALHVAIRAAHS